jgi:hypothetical protein
VYRALIVGIPIAGAGRQLEAVSHGCYFFR